jgi:hypothetical protein
LLFAFFRDVEAPDNAAQIENPDGIVESDSDIQSSDTSDSDTSQEREEAVQGIGEADLMLAEIANLKVKRSLMIHLQPLQQLCLRSVAFNLKYFLSKHQPFHSLRKYYILYILFVIWTNALTIIL